MNAAIGNADAPSIQTAQNAVPTAVDTDQLPRAIREVVIAFEALCTLNTIRHNADAADMSTPFHSVSEPPISIDRYTARFMRYLSCSDHGVLMGVIFAARYCACARLLPSRLTMHRLLLTGTLLGVKCHHDRFSSNKCYARIGGVSLEEVNALEILFFHGVAFRMKIEESQVHNVAEAARVVREAMASKPNHSLEDVVASLPEASIRILERAFYPIDELAEEIPNHVPTPAAAAKSQHMASDDDNDSSWAADGLKPNPSFAAVSPSSG
jgi:hypothetical protein